VPKSLQLGERGDMDDYLYQQCSGVRLKQVAGVRKKRFKGSGFTVQG